MLQTNIRVVARMIARPDKIEALRALLSGLVAPTRKESGCKTYELLQNAADPTDFTFVEEWTDGTALDAHFTTPHIKDALAKVPGLLSAEPDIRRYRLVC